MLRTVVSTFWCVLWCAAVSSASEPHVVARDIDRAIDQQLAAKKTPASPRAADAEFLRRVYLDLHGRPPSADRARAFLDSPDPDKRRGLIDELLAHEDYGRHQSNVWQTLIFPEQTNIHFIALVGRDGKKHFGDWLARGFRENRPWNQMVRDMVAAQGEIAKNPAVVFTMSNMDRARVRPDLLAVNTGRLFLGVQLQCVECHDHFTNDWKQSDFWGLAAFFGLTQFEGNGQPGVGAIREGAGVRRNPNVKRSSIVIPATGGNKGAGRTVRASFLGGKEPALPPAGPFRDVLADWIVAPDNPYFAPAAVNRWWGHFFGRGLVHPIDDMNAGHETLHGGLLALLAKEFRDSHYDQQHLVRCICNSDAYQRTSRPVAGNESDEELFSRMAVKVMTPEMLYDSLQAILGVKEIRIDAPETMRVLLPPEELARFRFVRFFRTRNADATEFTQGIPHALSLLNSETLNATSPTVQKLANLPPAEAVERLYLTALSRRPTSAEAKRFADFLAARPQARPLENYQAVLWILLNTTEFVLNH